LIFTSGAIQVDFRHQILTIMPCFSKVTTLSSSDPGSVAHPWFGTVFSICLPPAFAAWAKLQLFTSFFMCRSLPHPETDSSALEPNPARVRLGKISHEGF
jgi:hypothetical protein